MSIDTRAETPIPTEPVETASIFLRWMPRAVRRLGPGQRFLLALFLFLDVGILCFACLLLTGRILLPV
jgi:hypothetical protein